MLDWLGRLHVVLLHLPIGLLAGVVAVEAWARLRRRPELASSAGMLMTLSAVAAVVVAVCGLLLARGDDYRGDLVFWHRWLGLTLAAVTAVTAWLRWRWQGGGDGRWYAGGLVAAAALTLVVGHLGGSITHGRDFLFPASGEPTPSIPTGPEVAATNGDDDGPDAADLFTTAVRPILQDRCVECHGPDKTKAGLRLDSPEGIMAGGHDGPVVVAGHPERSPLVRLISLPHDHDDLMPSKGEPLSEAQIAVISDWIAAGAAFPGRAPSSDVADGEAPPTELDLAAERLPRPDPALLERLREAGFTVEAVSANGALLDLDAGGIGDEWTNGHLKLLQEARLHVAWLDLAGAPVGDEDLFVLRDMPQLRRLQLQHTAVTDAGLIHLAACGQLRSLNLFDTAISDAGVETLAGMTQLEALYLWQTRVTQVGANRLRRALPEATVNRGE